MFASFWIAHILAVHLNVPEPVKFELDNLWPSGKAAQMRQVLEKDEWIIQYDIDEWNKSSNSQRKYVIAHELCHGVYEYNVKWDSLSTREQVERHETIKKCAMKIMRDHRKCKWE